MYLSFIKQRNELCVGNTGHFVMETEFLHKNSTIKSQKYYYRSKITSITYTECISLLNET